MNDIDRYIKKGAKQVEGWLFRSDLEIFREVLDAQQAGGIAGAVVEIGAHHGKSFIPLAMANDGKNCYVIDLFGNQGANIDSSGNGDLDVFRGHLRNWGVDPSSVAIDARLSGEVQPDDIMSKVGRARFFHIDGGHHVEAVSGDIALACATILDDGVIAMDDMFRSEWPDVSQAAFQSPDFAKIGFVAFATGYNKTYFCAKHRVDFYQQRLFRSPMLRMLLSKHYHIGDTKMDIYQEQPLEHWRLRDFLKYYVRLYHPDFALKWLGNTRDHP